MNSVSRMPISDPSSPPSSAPIGMLPHVTVRMPATTRPSWRRGTSICCRVATLVLPMVMNNPLVKNIGSTMLSASAGGPTASGNMIWISEEQP